MNKDDCLKGNACFRVEFLKDFQIFGILSFEKSVKEMMSRACVYFWWLGFALNVWISLKGRVYLTREEVVCGVL